MTISRLNHSLDPKAKQKATQRPFEQSKKRTQPLDNEEKNQRKRGVREGVDRTEQNRGGGSWVKYIIQRTWHGTTQHPTHQRTTSNAPALLPRNHPPPSTFGIYIRATSSLLLFFIILKISLTFLLQTFCIPLSLPLPFLLPPPLFLPSFLLTFLPSFLHSFGQRPLPSINQYTTVTTFFTGNASLRLREIKGCEPGLQCLGPFHA